MLEKFHQIAMYVQDPEEAVRRLTVAGYTDWTYDEATLVGHVMGAPIETRGQMFFNYEFSNGELEFLHYRGPSWRVMFSMVGSHFEEGRHPVASRVAGCYVTSGQHPSKERQNCMSCGEATPNSAARKERETQPAMLPTFLRAIARSRSLIPPHTPMTSCFIAYARHCAMTGHARHICLAYDAFFPRSGKKRSPSTYWHSALSRHSMPSTRTLPSPTTPMVATVRVKGPGCQVLS